VSSSGVSALVGAHRKAIDAALAELSQPVRSFASDTTAPAQPEVLEAVLAANVGHAQSYGADALTREVIQRFKAEIGDESAEVRLTFSGTGANMLAAGLAGQPRLIAAIQSHIAVDEESGPLYLSGALETLIAAPDGRLDFAALRSALEQGPGLVCVTEATEDGTVYGIERLTEICSLAHAAGSPVMIDGARLPNAMATYGATLADVWATGVDHLVVGGSKAGLMAAEAVISRSGSPVWWRRSGQLPAKTRFVAAQWSAVLPKRWLAAAGSANARAAELAAALATHAIVPAHPVDVNLVFLDLDPECAAALADWAPASLWDRPGRIRFAASWDTDAEDVQRLAQGVIRAVLGRGIGEPSVEDGPQSAAPDVESDPVDGHAAG
jgi:threonine aldolase